MKVVKKHEIKHDIKKMFKSVIPAGEILVDGLIAVVSLILSVVTISRDEFRPLDINGTLLCIIAGTIFILCIIKIIIIINKLVHQEEYEKITLQEELSTQTLLHMSHSNDTKVNRILRTTYGEIYKWNPINYEENILVYDVHDQIRAILLGLKEMIIDISPGLSSDRECVDLVYCYPSNEYDGHIPIHESNKKAAFMKKWKVISSGDTSQYDHKLHDYLADRKSFYSYLDTCNYAFFNDKRDFKDNYVTNKKDNEYQNVGSIAGVVIELKNDCPEEVFVKAMLTISTYGDVLYHGNKKYTVDEYRDIFKENVINTYKSLLRSELAQMFIRHSIQKSRIDKKTGQYSRSELKLCPQLEKILSMCTCLKEAEDINRYCPLNGQPKD